MNSTLSDHVQGCEPTAPCKALHRKGLYPFDNIVIWFHQQDLNTEYSTPAWKVFLQHSSLEALNTVSINGQLAELYI